MEEKVLHFEYTSLTPQRLDRFLVVCLPDQSRSRIQGWIRQGRVTIDGKVADKAGIQLEGQTQVVLRIPPPEPAHVSPEPIPLDVVFENQDLFVVNKPAGMVVHPGAGHSHGTLVHAALAHAPEMEGVGGVHRPGVVHRLDKNTSGLIILAKNDVAHRWLQNQFRSGTVEKIYLALVDGRPPTPSGRVEAAIGRDPAHRSRLAVVPDSKGRRAVTNYRTQATFRQHTLLEVHPVTGRTHQIRVHMAFLGCPLVGDTLYGHHRSSLPLDRHFLHAARLRFRFPREDEPITLEAPLPPELEAILSILARTNSIKNLSGN